MSYLTQMLALTVQNFVSAAAGIAVLVALIRSFTVQEKETIGNFWVDLVRGTYYVLMPLSIVVALLLSFEGVVQTFESYAAYTPLQKLTAPVAATSAENAATDKPEPTLIALGPAASPVQLNSSAPIAVAFSTSTPLIH